MGTERCELYFAVARYQGIANTIVQLSRRCTSGLMAEAVRDGKLVIPISQELPLSEAAEAQAAAEKGGIGKILLVP